MFCNYDRLLTQCQKGHVKTHLADRLFHNLECLVWVFNGLQLSDSPIVNLHNILTFAPKNYLVCDGKAPNIPVYLRI